MVRQALISLLVLVIAAAGWVLLVPGAHESLSRLGIDLPFGASASAETGAQPAGAPGRGRGGRGGPGGAGRAITVVTAPVTQAAVNSRLNAIGDARAAQSVTVVAQSAGQIDAILVKPGDMVKAGQVLVQLDNRSESIDLEKAKLAAQDAADALARAKTLARSNATSAVQVQQAQLASDNAQLALKAAQLAYDKRAITSPIDGRVGLFEVTPGNYLAANASVTTVNDTSSILVGFSVPERFVSQLAIGMPVSVTTAALPGRTLEGKLTAIDNKLDPASRTIEARASIPNPDGALAPGMSLAVVLSFKGEQFPAVDPLAVQWSADGSYVWQDVDGKAHKVMAAIVERNSDGVLVNGPLKPGDEVITQGVELLAEGAPVRLLGGGPGGADEAGTASAGKPAPGAAEGRSGSKAGAAGGAGRSG